MPTLGAALDFQRLEAKSMAVHNLTTAPTSPAPVKGQMYFNTTDNTLYWYDGSSWIAAKATAAAGDATASAKGIVQLAGDLSGTAAAPTVANGAITSAKIADGTVTDTDVAAANKDGGAAVPSLRTLGNGAAQAAAGNDSRFTDARAPTGNAGGDLSGTYPNPQIAAGVIVDADVAVGNKDGAAATPSLRTLGSGAQQATAGNDARLSDARTPTAHKATHEPGGSDPMTVDAAGSTGSLRTLGASGNKAMPGVWDLSAISAATLTAATVNMNGNAISGVADPSSANHAATKNYVDNAVQGLDAKQSVKVATTASITAGGQPAGAQTIDGYVCQNSDRVLVKDQSNAQWNGIWQVVTGGSWNRVTDADAWTELPGAFVFVEQGTVNADTGWVCTVDQGGTLNTTPITWVQFSGAGQIISGAGLTKSGNTLDVGAGSGIQVNADSVQVAPNGIDNTMIADGAINLATADVTGTLPVGKGGTGATTVAGSRTALNAAGIYSSATHGAGSTWTIAAATHGLTASRALIVQCLVEATGVVILPDVVIAANGDVTITFGVSQTANTIRTSIYG